MPVYTSNVNVKAPVCGLWHHTYERFYWKMSVRSKNWITFLGHWCSI